MGISPAKFIGSDLLKLFGRKPDFLEIFVWTTLVHNVGLCFEWGKNIFLLGKNELHKTKPDALETITSFLEKGEKLEKAEMSKAVISPTPRTASVTH